MNLDLHYTDPRLVEMYDLENAGRDDINFYLGLATQLGAQNILDLGCGTGTLTVELATPNRKVVGVDPSPVMLSIARGKPGAEWVQWVEGDSGTLGTPGADLLLLTGNVAQVFLEDSDWAAVLSHAHAALRPGGHIAFESRNPKAREWEHWNPETTYTRIETSHGLVESWLEVAQVNSNTVRFEGHNVFKATGEDIIASSKLRFRSQAELTLSLTTAGFTIKHLYGNWQQEPFTDSSRLLVFVAQRV
jgi:SAM-dependent methyltransferase